MTVRRLLAYSAAVGVVVYVLAVWAPKASGVDEPPPAVTVTVVETRAALVDGHDVYWWSHRARRNGGRMRTVQATLRHGAGIGFGARRLAAAASPDGLVRAFLCIHRGEAPWASTRNPKYDGGLQMDAGFQNTYGPEFVRAWGSADRWPPFVQLAVALRAYFSGRGFYPWPNTARACGLLP